MLWLVFSGGFVVGRRYPYNQVRSNGPLSYSSVNQLYDILAQNFDGNLDNTKLIDGIKHGLVTATGDPYTIYFNSTEAKSFNEALSGSFSGIGAELASDKNKHIVIVSPLAGYPAAKAGLKTNDIVAAIDGTPTTNMTIDAAVLKIRGPVGKAVKLTIIRGAQTLQFKIVRAEIKLPSVESKIEGNIGILQISQFTTDTANLATKAAQNFKAHGVKAIILDLRGDPGGYLDAAIKVSSLWLNPGQEVVQTRRGSQVQSTDTANGNNILKGLPTVVLINGGSASASEITAGALHDNKFATLVGLKSFGKGSVQQVECLDNSVFNSSGDCSGAELKVTVARWYTPDGVNIDKAGIQPDIKVDFTVADQAAHRDPQMAKALAILKSKIR